VGHNTCRDAGSVRCVTDREKNCQTVLANVAARIRRDGALYRRPNLVGVL
jgi:hypothetical protein